MMAIKSVIIFLSLFNISLAFSNDKNLYRYDYKYDSDTGGWFKYHQVPSTFTGAFQRCKAEGAVLASPFTKHHRDEMISLHKANSNFCSCGIFTGVHATFSKGDYSSVEGYVLSKMPVEWAPEEPDNLDLNKDCTIMSENGTMAAAHCNDSYPYVCFKKFDDRHGMTECGTFDREYELDARTDSCYKFHRVARTWRQGAMTCMAEGGHLAIINSPTEVEVIKDIFAKVPPKAITSSFNYVAAIGIYDWGERGVWYTVHGETLQEAGYSSFSSGEPNNNTEHDGGSFCGAVFRNGLLDDIWCNEVNFPFICEKQTYSLIGQDYELK